MPCSLDINNLTVKVERGIIILKNISFRILKGVHALVGPNGAGKTTLLKAIAGIYDYVGKIAYCNNSTKEIPHMISYMPASSPIDPLATVEDVIRAGLFNSRGTINDAKRYMELLRIDSLFNRRFSSLSSGEQRLVCIVRALARRPALLLLDEPLSFLDVKNQVVVINLLKDYTSKNDAIVLLTTHEIHYLWMFDSVGVISNGSLLYHGDPPGLEKELLEKVYGVSLSSVALGRGQILFIPSINL